MAQVDEACVGRDAEHDGLADADELVGEPVVGEEGDDRRVEGLGHAATLSLAPAGARLTGPELVARGADGTYPACVYREAR